MKGKVIVITGSTQGIGLRTAEKLLAKGASVVINSRNEKKVRDVTRTLEKEGYNVLGVPGDISDMNFCRELCVEAVNKFGKIDYLINNAGISAKGTIHSTHPEVYESVYRINVLGSLYPTISLLPEIKKTKGGVIFISSLAGVIGLPSYSAYSGSKRSIVSLAESFKNELIDDGVFIGVNYPGFTENDKNKTTLNTEGNPEVIKKRTDVKVESLDHTVDRLIYQLEQRKFRTFSSFKGKVIQGMYRFFPRLSLYALKRNRRKIIEMD
jgi:short-subunit dehydrogenase